MLMFVTFFLAIFGYASLTAVLLISLNKKNFIVFLRITTVIIFLHVLMVWIIRYELQFAMAVRNGYSGFLIFHSALFMIFIATVVQEKVSKILLKFSFLLVTAGAIGAVFKYEIVSIYRIPVLIISLAGMIGLFLHYVSFFRKLIGKIITKKLPGKIQ